MNNKGFSITELVIAVAVSAVIVILVTSFARHLILFNSAAQSSMTATLESRKILTVMVSELRSAVPSALGSYPIESAATSSLVFFADVNNDDVADRIRYFLDPATLSVRRGVTLAAGSPPSYAGSQEVLTLVTAVANGPSLSLFQYFDGSSNLLPMPVNLQNIRLVKVNIRVQRDANRFPDEFMIFSSNAALRNLKDNL